MVRAYSAVVLLLLTAGCVREKPETPEATPPATPAAGTPETAKPAPAPAAEAPASTTKGKAVPPTSTTPAPKAQASRQAPAAPKAQAPRQAPAAPKAQAPKPVAPGASAAPPRAIAAATTLDLDALRAQLKATKAIGVFTKLALKNQVDDLLDEFRQHHAGKATPSITELRRSYDLLMMKVLSLLQDHDQKLASEIVSSRETIWGLLTDPRKFAALQA